jgi:phage tail-like protein
MAYQNPLSSLMTDPVRNFKFLVTFQGKEWTVPTEMQMGFVSLSGLSVTTEPIAYREGGYNTNVHQIPGQSAFTPITLSKGVMLGQSSNAAWMKRLFSVITPSISSGIGAGFRCDLDIQVLSHPNPQSSKGAGAAAATGSAAATQTQANTAYEQHTSLRFKVYNAWISSLSYSNLDAGANTLMVEEMSLVHEGFDVAYATGYELSKTAAEITPTTPAK